MHDERNAAPATPPAQAAAVATRVWDLPTRLFHWSLALLVVAAFATAKLGGLWMDWHQRAGYAILTLLLFRLLWGFAGGRYARFASFVRGPLGLLAYVGGQARHAAGHNPLGALSVLALLAALLLQAGTGLFATDDIFTEGPLAKLVSGAFAAAATRLHHQGEWLLYALVGLHLAAIAGYALFRRQNLVTPMLTGDAPIAAPAARDDALLRWRALLLLALCAALVGYVVTL